MKHSSRVISIRSIAMAVLLSGLVAVPSVSQAGFLDGIQNTMDRINSTADRAQRTSDQVQGTQNRLGGFLGKFGGTTAQTTQAGAGKVFLPKINNISLYQSPSKSGAVIRKISKGTEMVYSGTTSNGFYMVTTEHGTGWVDATLVQ